MSRAPVIGATWPLSLTMVGTNGLYYLHTSLALFQTPDSFIGPAVDSLEEHPSPRLNKEQFARPGSSAISPALLSSATEWILPIPSWQKKRMT